MCYRRRGNRVTGDTWGDRGHMGDRGDIEGRGLRGKWGHMGG